MTILQITRGDETMTDAKAIGLARWLEHFMADETIYLSQDERKLIIAALRSTAPQALAAPPAVPVRLDAWIRENFAGHGRALRRETDAPLDGEPWMSMDEAKELTRQAVALFGRAAAPAVGGERQALLILAAHLDRIAAKHLGLDSDIEAVKEAAIVLRRDASPPASPSPAVGGEDARTEALRVISTLAICEDGESAEQRALIVDACREVAANALAQPASPLPAVGGEPIAYRWKYKDEESCTFAKKPPDHLYYGKDIICEPLYAAPPASPLRGRDRLAPIVQKLDDTACMRSGKMDERLLYELLGAVRTVLASPPEQPAADSVMGRDALRKIRQLCDENLGPSRSSLLSRIAHIADTALSLTAPEPELPSAQS